MTSTTTGHTPTMKQQGQRADQHLNGAAIIDAEGREIPITENMICAALQALEAGEVDKQPRSPSRRPM